MFVDRDRGAVTSADIHTAVATADHRDCIRDRLITINTATPMINREPAAPPTIIRRFVVEDVVLDDVLECAASELDTAGADSTDVPADRPVTIPDEGVGDGEDD